jgi:hypothetical protein
MDLIPRALLYCWVSSSLCTLAPSAIASSSGQGLQSMDGVWALPWRTPPIICRRPNSQPLHHFSRTASTSPLEQFAHGGTAGMYLSVPWPPRRRKKGGLRLLSLRVSGKQPVLIKTSPSARQPCQAHVLGFLYFAFAPRFHHHPPPMCYGP